MLSKKNTMIKRSMLFFLLFLMGCNISANTNAIQKKVFELDLTDQGVSPEGGGIELFKDKKYCLLVVSLYGESRQEITKFQFINNKLIKSNYQKYRYKQGLFVIDDDLNDLIAKNDEKLSNDNDPELISNKFFLGGKNTKVVNEFNHYKLKIPKKVLTKNCT